MYGICKMWQYHISVGVSACCFYVAIVGWVVKASPIRLSSVIITISRVPSLIITINPHICLFSIQTIISRRLRTFCKVVCTIH